MTRRRPGIGGKRYGTPTGAPVPQAIDPASGFKVPLSELERQWDNQLIYKPFLDRRNPQDYLRGIKDNMALPYSRPEPPNTFMAGNIIWNSGRVDFAPLLDQDGNNVLTQDGDDVSLQTYESAPSGSEVFMTTQDGGAMLTQGEVATL